MESLKVKVMQRHIDRGRPRTISACPIALALCDALLTDNVTVGNDEMNINGRVYSVIGETKRFIDRFDDGKKVKPFYFLLSRK